MKTNKQITYLWHHGVVVITTAKLHSTKPELRFCAGSNPACDVLKICDGEDLWQWSQLEIRLNAFHRLTIPQKQFVNNRQEKLKNQNIELAAYAIIDYLIYLDSWHFKLHLKTNFKPKANLKFQILKVFTGSLWNKGQSKKKRERTDGNNRLIGFLRGQFLDIAKPKLEELPNFLTKIYTPKLSVFMISRLHNGISEQPTTNLIF